MHPKLAFFIPAATVTTFVEVKCENESETKLSILKKKTSKMLNVLDKLDIKVWKTTAGLNMKAGSV